MSTATPKLSMAELTKVAADRYGDAEAAEFQRDGEWSSMTYAELWDRAADLALGLIDLGVGPGDRVGVLSNTRVEFTLVDLAASSAGAVVVPVYPTNSADECQWVLGDSGATVVVCESPDHVARIESVRADLPSLRHVVVIAGPAGNAVPLADVEAAGRGADRGELERRAAAVEPDDACLIIYTSGTTGRPKGVVLTHKGFAAGRRSATEMEL